MLPIKAGHPESFLGIMPPKQGMDTSDLDRVIRQSRYDSIENHEDQ